jgi:hypothetical protein
MASSRVENSVQASSWQLKVCPWGVTVGRTITGGGGGAIVKGTIAGGVKEGSRIVVSGASGRATGRTALLGSMMTGSMIGGSRISESMEVERALGRS